MFTGENKQWQTGISPSSTVHREERFRSIMLHSAAGIALMTPDGRWLDVNEALCRMVGYEREELLGTSYRKVTHPEDHERDFAQLRRMLSGRIEAYQFEKRYIHKAGHVVWALLNVSLARAQDDVPMNLVVQVQDITSRKQIELAMRAVSVDLAMLEGEQLYEAAARQLAEVLGAEVGFIGKLDREQPDVVSTEVLVDRGQRRPNLSYPLEGTPCAEVFTNGSVCVVEEEAARLYPDDPILVAEGIEGYAGIPIHDRSGTAIGHIGALKRAPFPKGRPIEQILQIFSLAVAAAMTRERNRMQYKALFEFAPDAILMTDANGRIALANRQAEQVFGWTSGELAGKKIEELMPRATRQQHSMLRAGYLRSPTQRVMGFGRADLKALRKDGTVFPVEISLSPMETEDGLMIAAAVRDVSERRNAEQRTEELRARLETLISAANIGILVHRDRMPIIANEELARIFGHESVDEILALASVDPFLDRTAWARLAKVQGQHGGEAVPQVLLLHGKRKNGKEIDLEARSFAIGWGEESAECLMLTDVTEKLATEEQLRRSQRLDAIGQLTGGLAHDFNNLLTVMMGSAAELEEGLLATPALRRLAGTVRLAAERGSDLTNRLLTFSRQKALAPKATDISRLVAVMEPLLRRTLGEHIEIELSPGPALWDALVDGPQLEGALLNLCLNARDAMPDGGRLSVRMENVTPGDEVGEAEIDEDGDYVLLTITDSGIGMDEKTLAHAFEPFFTTKEIGKGSGLGLSMVYGFVKQSHGHVKIHSRPGLGTSVRIYLPRASRGAAAGEVNGHTATARGGSESILLVEDDELVRNYVTVQLAGLGYSVVDVCNGPEALELLRGGKDFDLLFTDIVMPGGISGMRLAEEARAIDPTMRVLFTSGYSESAVFDQGQRAKNVDLLSKPYRRSELAAKVRSLLDHVS